MIVIVGDGGALVTRRPEVFVRILSSDERERLRRISRMQGPSVRIRRANIILASAAHQSAPEIATLLQISTGYVRRLIHNFNRRGMTILDSGRNGGRIPRIGREAREQICSVAGTKPTNLGLTFTTWSLPRLATYLNEEEGLIVSRESVRQVLREEGVDWRSDEEDI